MSFWYLMHPLVRKVSLATSNKMFSFKEYFYFAQKPKIKNFLIDRLLKLKIEI